MIRPLIRSANRESDSRLGRTKCQRAELAACDRVLHLRDGLLYHRIGAFMRVIGGKYRGRRLKTVEGLAVRPTSDRLRETLFNILAPRIKGSRFLDLCAGSGAVGIEALSRGASDVVLVESSRTACSIIDANLKSLRVETGLSLTRCEATVALKQF